LEVTIHALVFVFILAMSVFSPRYRAKLKQEWDTSNSQRFAMVLGATVYSVALVFALFVWVPMLGSAKPADSSAKEQRSGSSIEFTNDEVEEMKKTQKLGELVDVAGNLLKRKLAEREHAKSDKDGIVVEER
jgi:hypothetical protein